MIRTVLLVGFLTLVLGAGEISITGTVVSDNQKMIGARFMGYVKNIYFEIGDKVRREQTLFELESAEFDILKNQADLVLQQAEIMVDMYRTRLDSIRREKAMFRSRDSSAKLDWEHIEISAQNAQAGLASARALLENATTKVKQMATIAN